MLASALLLVPDFAMIALGAVLHRLPPFDEAFWPALEKLVYFVLFPSLLFGSIVATHFDFGASAWMLAAGLGALGAGMLLAIAGRPLARDGRVFASSFQCAFRFNSYIALALASRVGGAAGLAQMALLLGVGIPVANAAAVTALARHGGGGLLRELGRNPLLIATVAGLALNLAGVTLPDPVAASFKRAGDASIALGLITVGAGLRLGALHGSRALVGWITVVKLVLVPCAALGLARAFGLEPAQRSIVVLFAAMPTASSAYILAQRMGGDGSIVALLISIGTLACVLTLPAWLSVLT